MTRMTFNFRNEPDFLNFYSAIYDKLVGGEWHFRGYKNVTYSYTDESPIKTSYDAEVVNFNDDEFEALYDKLHDYADTFRGFITGEYEVTHEAGD